MRTPVDQRPSGIRAVGELPWGSHFCVFYASQRELLEVLVPFIGAGLACNELCSWEVDAPLTVDEVTRALGEAVPDLAGYVARGQVEIRPPPGRSETVEGHLDRAILAGFDGLRLVRHAAPIASGRGPAEAESIGRLNVIAAFPYPRAELGVVALIERVQDHRFALLCNSGRWEILKGSEARTARDALKRSEDKLQSLFRNMSEGFAYHRIVLDGRGRPRDYVFLEVNPAFERLTGLVAQQVLGKRVTEVLPGIETDPTDWIGRYGRVALTGEPAQFESHAVALDKWFAVSVFSPHKGYFAVTFADITARKRAEAERRAAEERLLVTLRSIGDAVISTDTAGNAITLNRVAEELTGFTEAEAAGKPLREIFDIIHEETGEPAEDPVRAVIESGRVVGLAKDVALVRRDGRRISIADSAAPVRSESGDLLGVVLVFRDVTEERRAEREQALEKAELGLANEILEVFLKESSDAVFRKALEIVLSGTGSRRGIFGYIAENGDLVCPTLADAGVSVECVRLPPSEWVMPWRGALLEKRAVVSRERFAPAGRPAFEDDLAVPILLQGEPIGILSLAKAEPGFTDGDRELVEAIARRVAPVLYAWIQRELRDEERTASERALRASEARFRLLSDSASLLLSTDDPQAVVSRLCRDVMEHLDCQAFFNFLADPASEKLHLNACAGIPDAEARGIERVDYGVAVCGCVARDEQRILVEDVLRSHDPRADLVRSYGIQAYCCHPLIAEGRLVGTLSFGTRTRPRFTDDEVAVMKTVSDQVAVAMQRIQAQRALHEANQRLQEADRRKDEFLAVLSHELRNPLAPVRNSIYILRHGEPGGEQARRAQDVIARQAEHLTRLVDDLLDVTRIARGKIELRRSRIDLCEVLRRAADDFRSTMEERGIAFRTALPDARLWAEADPTRVTQIVGNLLHNAAKFTCRGGEVTLALQVGGEAAEIRVRDTGTGIDASLLPRVFDAFVQGERTLARTEGGLGLGLALVKGITELHGGTVRGESAGRGRGAEFIVRLPLHGPAAAAGVRSEGGRRASGARRVLVVDDNVDAAQSLAEIVELLGHAADVAHDGPDALAKVRANPPDVVLCDIGLPGMSGYEIAQALRRDGHAMQLFAISGYAQPADVRNAVEAGFDGHVAKPVDVAEIDRLLT